jgi:type VI secretion system protein VasJ
MDRVESPQLAGRLLDQHLQKLREIAGQAWIQDSANPLPYRINRTTVWCGIEDLPPAIHNRTRIPAPDHQVIKMLFDLRNAGDAEALLKAAEGRVPQYVLWLDLSRFSAEALARLGGKYRRAYHAVCQETAYFVHRLPGLDDLTFADGTPFANPETQCWLKSIALSAGSDGEAVSQTRQRSNEPMSQDIAEIQGMILKGKWIEGMEILQKKLTAAQSSREKILWRMAFAQLMLDIRQPRWALPQLEQIIRDIDLYRLEDYDPMLALRGLKIAWQGMDAQNDERMKAKATDILHRIACIDMAEMIRLGKN